MSKFRLKLKTGMFAVNHRHKMFQSLEVLEVILRKHFHVGHEQWRSEN